MRPVVLYHAGESYSSEYSQGPDYGCKLQQCVYRAKERCRGQQRSVQPNAIRPYIKLRGAAAGAAVGVLRAPPPGPIPVARFMI